MGKTLMILEVSRKQDYIFSSKELKENEARSADISYVTGSDFFDRAAGELYRESENLVYAGGGHTVLQFDDANTATQFARQVTETALRKFNGLELFVKQLPYDEAGRTPAEKLTALTEALERKKSVRKSALRQMSLGVEALDEETFLPKQKIGKEPVQSAHVLDAPVGWVFPAKFSELTGKDNFIAVIHIDGNAMGKRVKNIYDRQTSGDWNSCCKALRKFSEGIQKDFKDAFLEMVNETIAQAPDGLKQPILPLRPIILAGDDVCFVTAGSIALECARVFLEKLAAKTNPEDKKHYAACAGVAIVHQKFPFHQAYDLAEELCDNAKKLGAALREDGSISAMDWHIEFGQMKDSLSELRRDYETEDGNRLELRPVVVLVPEPSDEEKAKIAQKTEDQRRADENVMNIRSYAFFSGMCRAMQGECGKTARGKIKELRTALKQGEVESRFFMHDQNINDLLYHAVNSEYRNDAALHSLYQQMITKEEKLDKHAFRQLGDEPIKRCLFFDAVEMIDHCTFFEEGKA